MSLAPVTVMPFACALISRSSERLPGCTTVTKKMASEATTGVAFVIVSVIESARALIALDARERRRVPEQRR